MGNPQKIAVFYLLRNGNDPLLFRAFLNSLRLNVTSIDYIPIVIQKGFAGPQAHPLAASWVNEAGRRGRGVAYLR